MSKVFLSYAAEDHFFAGLAVVTLAAAEIELWRDIHQIAAGSEWREGIETEISNCLAVVVALSPHSAKSAYVTYEWAYALGKGKPVIPLKLSECEMHKRLENIQYLDFSVPMAQPWDPLIARIREEETKAKSAQQPPSAEHVNAILGYVNQQLHQLAVWPVRPG